jgi:hypothetical protein
MRMTLPARRFPIAAVPCRYALLRPLLITESALRLLGPIGEANGVLMPPIARKGGRLADRAVDGGGGEAS